MGELTETRQVHCANCGAPMVGEYCHHCGQSIHSVLKPVHHMLEDGMDMFLHLDGRIVHTLPPLALRPGFLTLEYFAGRRQRYVPPFRLMFVLSLLAFFAFHVAVNVIADRTQQVIADDTNVDVRAFADDDTPDEVRAELRQQLRDLMADSMTARFSRDGRKSLDAAVASLQSAADSRLVELGASPTTAASAPAIATTASAPTGSKSAVSARPADPPDHGQRAVHPAQIAWLPDFANARLAALELQAHTNFEQMLHGKDAQARREARERIIAGFFGVLPQAMLVMIPVFALLLKLFYVFRRRLYMEHLIVALHSHAFLFLALLVVVLAGMASTWLKPHAAWTGWVLGAGQAATLVWMPAYLLVMQKRVYRQGWLLTLLKYGCIGWCYLWLLLTVLMSAFVLGIAH